MRTLDVHNQIDPTRKSLLSRLKDRDDQASWKDFFDTYWSLIYAAAIRAGLTDSEAQEVVQETVISVSKSMPTFHYDRQAGSFKGWLLRLTRWRIADQFRKRQPDQSWNRQAPGSKDQTPTAERVADPKGLNLETIWDNEWETNLFSAAIDRVKKRIDPRQYQIFDLYVLKEWPASKVAKSLNISTARVYLAKHRVSSLIKEQVLYLESHLF